MREGKFRDEELHGLYCSVNTRGLEIKSRNMRWVGHVTVIGKRRACRALVRKSGGNNRLGRPELR